VLDDPAHRKLRVELEAAGRAFNELDRKRQAAVERRRRAVEAARAVGASWTEIAEVLGLESRQAAEQISARQAAKREA